MKWSRKCFSSWIRSFISGQIWFDFRSSTEPISSFVHANPENRARIYSRTYQFWEEPDDPQTKSDQETSKSGPWSTVRLSNFFKKIAKSCSAHVKGPNPKQHFEWRIWNWATIPMYQVFSIKITFFNWKSLKSCWHDEDMFEHGFLQNLFHKV